MGIYLFFFFSGLQQPDLKNQYYTLVDEYEILDDKTVRLELDGINAYDFDLLEDKTGSTSILESDLITHFFQLNISLAQFEEIRKEAGGENNISNIWIRLKITQYNTGLPILQYSDSELYPPIQEKYLEWMDSFENEKSLKSQVKSFFANNRFSASSKEQVTGLMKAIPEINNDIHLNVYDVGQGNLTAVCNIYEEPLFYFDLGGGFAWNRHTYLNKLNLCWCKANTIFISHWDKDHVETIRRTKYTGLNEINNKIWITSQVPVTPFYIKMALMLKNSGHLIIWPKKYIYNDGKIEIGQAGGPESDKNNSGLYLIVHSNDKNYKRVINPADAAYKFLPLKTLKFEGLLATHHGANFLISNHPAPSTAIGCIAYSCGLNNIYTHPRPEAVRTYLQNGYLTSLDTRHDKNISFSNVSSSQSHNCINPACDLLRLNHFT